MSVYDNKANYHPVSQINGHVPNGSYILPGNGYYSVTGAPPRVKFDHTDAIQNPQYRHTQSYRIDPIHTLLSLKEESTMTKYHHHNPPVEMARDRYIFVPTFSNRDDPSVIPNAELTIFKQIAEDPRDYCLNKVSKLPDVDYNVLPDKNLNDEVYRTYKPDYPYDLMVLRDTDKHNPAKYGFLPSSDPNFVSSTTLIAKP